MGSSHSHWLHLQCGSRFRAEIALQSSLPYAGHPMSNVDARMLGDDEFDGLVGRTSQVNGMCLAAEGISFDLAVMRMTFDMLQADATDEGVKSDEKAEEKPEEKKEEKKQEEPKEQMLDGMPESFVGPLVAHLVAHEVGHTLGLRHNFKASSIHTLAEINSEAVKGKQQMAGSVMDYIGANIRLDSGSLQGDYCMTWCGPVRHVGHRIRLHIWRPEAGSGPSRRTGTCVRHGRRHWRP